MTASSKTPSAPGISRLLAKAGFERSVSRSFRSGARSTSGFRVSASYGPAGGTEVRHITWSMNPPRNIVSEWLGKYADVITAAGYAATRPEDRDILIVTSGKADQ